MQLDSMIDPPSKKKNNLFSNLIASVIALFSLHSAVASYNERPITTTRATGSKTGQTDSLPQKIIISGVVSDENGNKLQGAQVSFGGNKVAETKDDGSYEFEITNWTNKSYLIQYSLPGMVTTSRSFHPAMRSSQYNITLGKPHFTDGFVTMGVPLITYLNFRDTSISFKFNDKGLSKESEDMISELAMQMRNYPGATITITGEVNSGKGITTCQKLTSLVMKRLTDHEGISPDRIRISKEPLINQQQNVIRIESVKEQ